MTLGLNCKEKMCKMTEKALACHSLHRVFFLSSETNVKSVFFYVYYILDSKKKLNPPPPKKTKNKKQTSIVP